MFEIDEDGAIYAITKSDCFMQSWHLAAQRVRYVFAGKFDVASPSRNVKEKSIPSSMIGTPRHRRRRSTSGTTWTRRSSFLMAT